MYECGVRVGGGTFVIVIVRELERSNERSYVNQRDVFFSYRRIKK